MMRGFFSGLVNTIEVRVEEPEIQQIVKSAIDIGEAMNALDTALEQGRISADERNFSLRYRQRHANAEGGRGELKRTQPDIQIDLICAIITKPGAELVLMVGGNNLLRATANEHGRVEFDPPLNVMALSYAEIRIVCKESVTLDCIACFGEPRRRVGSLSSKSIGWQHHPGMELQYYYRGMLLPWGSQEYAF
jgi:hypothetical protein